MRTVVLSLSSLIFLVPALQAQAPEPWGPKLVVGYEKEGPKALTKDFGVVGHGGQFLHTFKLYNPYQVPLTIDTKVECSCVTLSPTTIVIQPKQYADLNITMDTSRFLGNKRVKIWLFIGPNPFTSEATLQVTAQIRADLVLNPGHINLGSVKNGQASAVQSLDVAYAGATDFRITEVVENSSPVKLTVQELYRGPGQGGYRVGYRVSAGLKENASAGGFRQEIFLRTNDPAGPLLLIPVEGMVMAPLSAVPNTLDLGTMKLGEEKLQKVIVRGGRPFLITSIDGAGDGITYDLPTAPSAIQTVVFHYQAGKTGDVSRKLQIKTDIDSAVSIKVEGAVGP